MSKHQSPKTLIEAAMCVLRALGRPATAREIADGVQQDPKLANCLSGKTPHKTLNARISVDILNHGESSRFYRFAPGAYGLREYLEQGKYEQSYRRIFIGRHRRKEVANEEVAVVDASKLKFFETDGFYTAEAFPLTLLDLLDVRYVDRKIAETRIDIKQLVSYAYIYHEDTVLSFEKGTYTSDDGEFIGKQSIGFGGHLNYDDLSLFDDTPAGLNLNLLRELNEELYIFSKSLRNIVAEITFAGFLVDSSTDNGRKHLGLAASVRLHQRLEIETPTLGIRNLRWLSARHTPNSFSQFEIWSQYLFRHFQTLAGSRG